MEKLFRFLLAALLMLLSAFSSRLAKTLREKHFPTDNSPFIEPLHEAGANLSKRGEKNLHKASFYISPSFKKFFITLKKWLS